MIRRPRRPAAPHDLIAACTLNLSALQLSDTVTRHAYVTAYVEFEIQMSIQSIGYRSHYN